MLEELHAELEGKAIIKFVDVWKYQELVQGYPISLIPTQIFIDASGKPYKPKDPKARQMKLYSSRDNGEHVFTVHEVSKNTKRGFIGAFIAGILGGFFSSPCATPVLVALLAMVAKEGSLLWGILLLLLYSIGDSFLVLIAGTSVGFVHKLSSSEKYGGVSKILRILMGVLIMLIAFYMFYLGF